MPKGNIGACLRASYMEAMLYIACPSVLARDNRGLRALLFNKITHTCLQLLAMYNPHCNISATVQFRIRLYK